VLFERVGSPRLRMCSKSLCVRSWTIVFLRVATASTAVAGVSQSLSSWRRFMLLQARPHLHGYRQQWRSPLWCILSWRLPLPCVLSLPCRRRRRGG
jgi:hypothetical protein